MSKDNITKAYVNIKNKLSLIVRRIVKEPNDVEDILQDAYIKTYVASQKQKIQSPEAFLNKTARNLALNHIELSRVKYSQSREENSFPAVNDDIQSLEDSVDSQKRFLHVCRVVRELPEQCRKVFIYKKVYGMSYKEISDKLGISEKTIEKHVAKGVKRCSEYLETRQMTKSDRVERVIEEAQFKK